MVSLRHWVFGLCALATLVSCDRTEVGESVVTDRSALQGESFVATEIVAEGGSVVKGEATIGERCQPALTDLPDPAPKVARGKDDPAHFRSEVNSKARPPEGQTRKLPPVAPNVIQAQTRYLKALADRTTALAAMDEGQRNREMAVLKRQFMGTDAVTFRGQP